LFSLGKIFSAKGIADFSELLELEIRDTTNKAELEALFKCNVIITAARIVSKH